MRFEYYLNEKVFLSDIMKKVIETIKPKLYKLSFEELKQIAEKEWLKVDAQLTPEQKEQLLKIAGLKPLRESVINEDARHWWELVKQEAFPTLAFYPALQVWLEMDKYIKGDNFNTKVMMFYAALWLVLVSGKYVAGWLKWKKEKPDEYEAERSIGRGGII